ncbi:hypothetical protein K2V61_00175 [Staphylococcus simulans]|uniref:hypothetical protein n=1 Tax=Staphylococcus simulans TaxID=1286 RepID=UPI001E2C5F38|nr:hypothetical protein [Staphylococcus simulans]MCD8913972.1 hypothetical protein [Staphylococcus simulans]
MKKLIGLSMILVFLLAACGNTVDGTYVNKKDHVTLKANDKNKTAVLTVEMFGVPIDVKGKIDTDKETITFKDSETTEKYNYEFDGDQLVLYQKVDGKKKGIKLDKKEK